MSSMARASAPLRLALMIALLCAVGLRLLTPPGWMPNVDGRPGSLLVICTGEGARTVSAPADHAPAPTDQKSHHDVCPFAGFAAAPSPDLVAMATPADFATAVVATPPSGLVSAAPSWRRAQAQRAPPPTV